MTSDDILNNSLAIPARRSLSDDVVDRLREAIHSGRFQPGFRLREEELAELLNVSRGPVREALAQLEREGLVIKEANKSAVVAPLSRKDLEEVYSLRQALEQLAVRQATRINNPEHIVRLEAIVDEMAMCLKRGITEQEAAQLDINFHEIIIEAANHRRLYEFWSNLRPQIHIFLLSRNVANPDFRDYILDMHQDIIDAIRNGDEAHAVACIHEHLEMAYARILEGYSSQTEELDSGES